MDEFKTCPKCGLRWPSRDAFLADPNVTLAGYQVNFTALKTGFFLFNHIPCGTTMALPVAPFTDLYDGPVFQNRHTGEDDCPGYCLHEDCLDPCPAQCECAYVRAVMQRIRNGPALP